MSQATVGSNLSLDICSQAAGLNPTGCLLSEITIVERTDRAIDFETSEQDQRKKATSISDIPPEVLSQIFVIVRDAVRASFNYELILPTAWIPAATRVCRYWRQVALNCPELWSIPFLLVPELAETMLRRSKMAPLTIEAGLTYLRIKTVEAALAHHHTHIQRLYLLFGNSGVDNGRICRALCGSMPILETLFLSAGQMVTLPENAFHDSPRLRHIHCQGVYISWDSPFIKQNCLTTLRLRYSNEVVPAVATTPQLLDVLAITPRLRILELHYALRAQDGTSGQDCPLVFLKSLESLTVTSKSVVACSLLLRHLRCSPATIIKILCPGFEGALVHRSSIISGVAATKHYSDWQVNAARLDLSDSSMIYETFKALPEETAVKENTEMILGEPYALTSSITLYFSLSEHLVSLFGSIFSAFNLNQLKNLVLLVEPPVSIPRLTLRQNLGYLRELRTIHLDGKCTPLCSAIYGNPESQYLLPLEGGAGSRPIRSLSNPGPTSPHPRVPFRSLKNLIIKPWDDVDTLVNMVTRRHDMNAPIEHLYLPNGIHLDSAILRRLCEAVTNVRFWGPDEELERVPLH